MKKSIYITLGLLLLAGVCQAQILFFQGSFEDALKKAKEDKKNLFVDFYTVWCGPCKLMDKEVFTQKSVGDYFNETFICCHLDAELPENKPLAKKYNVKAFPTMILMDANGKELKRLKGACAAEQLLKDVKVANGDELSFEQLYEKYKKNKKDFDIQQELLIEAPYFIMGVEGYDRDKWSVRIETLFDEYVKNKGLENMVNGPDLVIFRTYHTEIGKEDPIFEHVVKNYERYCEALNKPDVSDYIIELNNRYIIQMCKKGNQDYKARLERIKGDMSAPYAGNSFGSLSVYEAVSYLADGTYYLFKQKDEKSYFEAMDKYLAGLGAEASVNDYSQVLEDLYVASETKLSEAGFQKSIVWIGQALEKDMSESVRVRLLVMLSDCYVGTGLREKAKQALNQAFLVSVRIENKGEQKQMQDIVKAKLEQI
ncbi:MAG: thioredoxin family protein [Odoribacter sp.]